MVVLATGHGNLEVSEVLIHAVIHEARTQARLAAIVIKSLLVTPSASSDEPFIGLPPAFLLELGAVLQILQWERLGLQHHIQVDLPSGQEAWVGLADRAAKGPTAFVGHDAIALTRQVFAAWINCLAWDALELLGTNVTLVGFDDDSLVDNIADFVWHNRHELDRLVELKDTQAQ